MADPYPVHMQLIQQVRHALRLRVLHEGELGVLHEGDKLPTVKDVVAQVAINPNTVSKAYRELEYEGLVAARPGVGTFVTKTLGGESLAKHEPLRQSLERRLSEAREAGVEDESIEALMVSTLRLFSEGTDHD